MSNLNDIEQKNYDSVSDMLTDKLDELENAFKENLELNNKLQINTMNLVSRVSELKGYIATLSTEIRDTKTAIANNNYENLNDSINRLTRILSFSTEREPKRVRKVMSEAPDSTTGVTITESSLEFNDGDIEDITLDFNSLMNEATSAELEDSLRNSFNNASNDDVTAFEEFDNTDDDTIISATNTEPSVVATNEQASVNTVTTNEPVVATTNEPVVATTDEHVVAMTNEQVSPTTNEQVSPTTNEQVSPTTNEQGKAVTNPASKDNTVVSTKSVASGSVLALLRNSKIR